MATRHDKNFPYSRAADTCYNLRCLLQRHVLQVRLQQPGPTLNIKPNIQGLHMLALHTPAALAQL
jgi:hypothetical protein